jgi:hypothetical protein
MRRIWRRVREVQRMRKDESQKLERGVQYSATVVSIRKQQALGKRGKMLDA